MSINQNVLESQCCYTGARKPFPYRLATVPGYRVPRNEPGFGKRRAEWNVKFNAFFQSRGLDFRFN